MTLDGADFSGTDLRGADFSAASLVGADFSNARLGARPLTGWLILTAAVAVSVVAGIVIGSFASTVREQVTAPDWRDVFGAQLLVAVVLVFFGTLIGLGVRRALLATLTVLVVAILVDFALVYSVAGEVRFGNAFTLLGLLLSSALAALAGVLGRVVGGTFGAWAIGAVAALGGLAAGRAEGGLAAIVVSVLLVYISKRALKLDERDRPIRRLAHRIVTHRGTRFTGADVTQATFTGTHLAQADMSGAVLAGATWEPGKGPVLFDNDT
jgi:uncharacterized protein YjbI with pentapeptide repeats